jgi:hypothetical protein
VSLCYGLLTRHLVPPLQEMGVTTSTSNTVETVLTHIVEEKEEALYKISTSNPVHMCQNHSDGVQLCASFGCEKLFRGRQTFSGAKTDLPTSTWLPKLSFWVALDKTPIYRVICRVKFVR